MSIAQTWGRIACVIAVASLVACGDGAPGAPPTAPSAVSPQRTGLPGSPQASFAPAPSAGEPMPVSSTALKPEGFRFVSRVDPKPDDDGVFRGTAPLTIEIDLCGSTADAGKTLTFLFDWTYDHRSDVKGGSDVCHQKHTYRFPADGPAQASVRSNICVANGDPTAGDPSVYTSCRTLTFALEKPAAPAGPTSGPAPACYTDGEDSIQWPGGTGPMFVPTFFGTVCGGDVFLQNMVFGATLEDAEARCGGSVDDFGSGVQVPGGTLYFCNAT